MRQYFRMGSRFLTVIAFVVFSGAAALTCYGLVIKSQAADLLKDVVALKPGVSNGSEARQVYQKHQRLIFQSSNPCDVDTCAVIFTVQNTWLSKLRVEPPAKFEANFSVRNGKVDAIGAYLFRSMPIYPTFQGSAGDVMETVEMPRSLGSTSGHYLFPTPVGKPYLRVALDSHADLIQRQHAFEFSLWCLVKPGGGCDLPCDYLPSAWQDWKASLPDFFTKDFLDQHYPNNERCKR